MRKIKIALIGLNKLSHSTEILSCVKKQNDIFDVVGFALPENEREKYPDKLPVLEGLQEFSVEEIMKNPEIEAVLIETDEIYLTKYAILAAKHKKHIHMEKPGGCNLEEFEELIATVKNNSKVFHIGYMYRYNPYVRELIQKAKNGDLGEITSVEAQMNCHHRPAHRQWLGSLPGGIMFFLGCHLIDIILQINGVPDEVIPLNCCTGVDGVTAVDIGMAVFKYKNGTSFAKVPSGEIGGFPRRQIAVSGTKGTFEIKPIETITDEGIITTKTEYSKEQKWNEPGITTTSKPYGRYDDMMASFAEMVRGEKENPWSYDYELMLYKTLLKACKTN